ncbi:MAG: sigma-70 family RNA polymerase sigma factor [Deltaproteobacteria bacterium]|nr:sigma-70 family RNA polymerase sigma factor [Deltaproteobacteria bacterium]
MDADLDELLRRSAAGEEGAREALFASAYRELQALARARLLGGGRNTLLDTSVLVQESFLRLAGAGRLQAASRGQFFAYASRVMRSVIVDFARERLAEKRGGDLQKVTLTTRLAEGLVAGEEEVLRIHEALERLAGLEPRLGQVVEMRFFAGLPADEVAAALGISPRTLARDWEKARLLLAALLRGREPEAG